MCVGGPKVCSNTVFDMLCPSTCQTMPGSLWQVAVRDRGLYPTSVLDPITEGATLKWTTPDRGCAHHAHAWSTLGKVAQFSWMPPQARATSTLWLNAARFGREPLAKNTTLWRAWRALLQYVCLRGPKGVQTVTTLLIRVKYYNTGTGSTSACLKCLWPSYSMHWIHLWRQDGTYTSLWSGRPRAARLRACSTPICNWPSWPSYLENKHSWQSW